MAKITKIQKLKDKLLFFLLKNSFEATTDPQEKVEYLLLAYQHNSPDLDDMMNQIDFEIKL